MKKFDQSNVGDAVIVVVQGQIINGKISSMMSPEGAKNNLGRELVEVHLDGYGFEIFDAHEVTLINKSSQSPKTIFESMDIDSGLGIGGINNDQSMPIIPSVTAIERVQKKHDTDTICKCCGASANFDGAMFTTLRGSNICDDCA